jgi:hypothetical protein
VRPLTVSVRGPGERTRAVEKSSVIIIVASKRRGRKRRSRTEE